MPAAADDLREVRWLLTNIIDTFEKLEIVAHVFRAPADGSSTAGIAAATNLVTAAVSEALAELRRDGVIARGTAPDSWLFAKDSPHAGAVATLLTDYEDDRVKVHRLMIELSLDRVRSQAATVFADAFLLRPRRKGDPDG